MCTRPTAELRNGCNPFPIHPQVAHGILFETIRQLEDQGIHVPQSLRRSFVLLHSYILVGASFLFFCWNER